MMLHTKYNGVGPCGFRQYFFFYICCKKLYKTKGHNLNKLGKVALGDVQLCEYCFMLSLLKPM